MFPAYAGMNRSRDKMDGGEGSVPRIRGDEPPLHVVLMTRQTCSPHTRG